MPLAENNKTTSVNESTETATGEENIESLKRNLEEERERANKYLGNWQRSEADFSNYKKRAEQEKNEFTAFANSSLILNLLPVLDDLERALASLPPKLADLTWVEGIKLIHRKLKAVLESHGLTEVEAIGKPFDPNFHEAVAHVEGDDGMVVNEIQKGYKLKNKLLRPTLVTVGNGAKTEGKTEEEQPENNRL